MNTDKRDPAGPVSAGEGTAQKAEPPYIPPSLHKGAPAPLVLDGQLINDLSDLQRATMEGESRKLTLQTEAAINLAIGLVLTSFGEQEFTIHDETLKNFSEHYRVEQMVNPDGSYTLRVMGHTTKDLFTKE